MSKKNLSAKRVPLSPELRKIPAVKVLWDKPVDCVELGFDIEDEAMAVLAQAGLEAIQKDKEALVSYAITEALKDLVRSEKEKDARHIA